MGQLTVLQTLDLNECSSLESLPAEIGQLAGLEMLNLCGCSALRSLPTALILGTRPTQDLGGGLQDVPVGLGDAFFRRSSKPIELGTSGPPDAVLEA